jgi:hypothetical protein
MSFSAVQLAVITQALRDKIQAAYGDPVPTNDNVLDEEHPWIITLREAERQHDRATLDELNDHQVVEGLLARASEMAGETPLGLGSGESMAREQRRSDYARLLGEYTRRELGLRWFE